VSDRIVHFGQRSCEPGFTYIFGVQPYEGVPGTHLRSSDGTLYTVVDYEPGIARCISDEPFVTDEGIAAWLGAKDRVDG
jgi:hypothetical protein